MTSSSADQQTKRRRYGSLRRRVIRSNPISKSRNPITPLDVAFVQLRGLLPRFLSTRRSLRMNKIEIIRQTLRYIVILNQILERN